MAAEPTLVVFSHLRWNFVYQRPQHLFSRLSRQWPVLFIEEPQYDDSRDEYWQRSTPTENVTVCVPHTPLRSQGFCDEQLPLLCSLVRELIEEQSLDRPLVWFHTPLPLPLADLFNPRLMIYDCMDELSAFLHAPPQLIERERELLKRCQLVFTGGPSLYRAKRDRHPHVHCFPSSVDAAHFRQALNCEEAADQQNIRHPRLGYVGVIDERIDLQLLDMLASSRPEWQIVMVGPVVKIGESSLPRRENLHYLGGRPYADLPRYLAGWDACLLPFARNESTRYISPTKTLEYMATELPIISTPIADVVDLYRDIVYLGETPGEFIGACDQALNSSEQERATRTAGMRRVLSATSWDTTAGRIQELINDALREPAAETQAARGVSAFKGGMTAHVDGAAAKPHPQNGRAPSSRQTAETVVIGAGPTGLSAAYHLGPGSLLLEQSDRVGGLCRSFECDGFTFDAAGHIMFSNDPCVHEMYQMLLGSNVHWQDREAWIFSHGVYTRYPFQGALYGLPPEVIKECLLGAIEARYGSPHDTPDSSQAGAECGNGELDDCCADGVLESTAPLGRNGRREPRNFEEFIYQVWGRGIAKHFAIPYNRKLWAVPLSEMETSWLGGRVPLPNLAEMIDGALQPVPKPMGPNARFGYPLRGGFQSLMDGFLPHLKGRLELNARVAAVSPRERQLTLADGRAIGYRALINTMPLPTLVRMLGAQAPAAVREAASRLRYVSVRCVHLGIGREKLTNMHWIYCPENTVFHRIFVQGNASPHCNPPGGFGLTCEITYSPHKPLPCDGEALTELCIEGCQQLGLFTPEDPVLTSLHVDLPHAYVVYDHARANNVRLIRQWLAEQDILLAGRYSEWEYYNSDHAFIAGKNAAEQVAQRLRPSLAESPRFIARQRTANTESSRR